ncbi:hypothetical protein C2S53_010989 [Perilla frutescens var. hirtella]|uniref:F-box associated beta-propeller type 1 domain-containing protein n=1 Tax=Perilla frutescens var. hirtella TaxID=608512 RepID=A0AAD4JDD4_PERFH|nr:hypothetical protein C2S53_010989 [Perilla frutescens var. hirtella]
MRKLLLMRAPHNPQRPGRIVKSAEEESILAQRYFSRLSVPRLLSGKPGAKKIHAHFLSSGIVNYVNQCCGLLYFADSGPGASLVWNPSTEAERYIPPPGADVLCTPKVGYTYSVTSCLGYDPRSGALKVLKYVRNVYQRMEKNGIAYDIYGADRDHYLLYSTQTNCWVDFPCPEDSYQLNHGSVYLNGCGFWLAYCTKDAVVSFSFSDENFSSFPLSIPTLNGSDHGYKVIMVEVDEENTLGFVVYRKSHFQFWTCVINSGRMPEPDDDGCVWLKRWEFCVDFPEECGTSSVIIHGWEDSREGWEDYREGCGTSSWIIGDKGTPLLVYDNGDELLMFMVNLNDQLMVYSSAAKELKLLPLFSYPRALELISYNETTFDPNSV